MSEKETPEQKEQETLEAAMGLIPMVVTLKALHLKLFVSRKRVTLQVHVLN